MRGNLAKRKKDKIIVVPIVVVAVVVVVVVVVVVSIFVVAIFVVVVRVVLVVFVFDSLELVNLVDCESDDFFLV